VLFQKFDRLGDGDRGGVALKLFDFSTSAEQGIEVEKVRDRDPFVEAKFPRVRGVVGEQGNSGAAMTVEIDPQRRDDLLKEIKEISQRGRLSPTEAGKLKGRLLFAATQLWGKTGRAFFLALSERQYAKSQVTHLSVPITLALESWAWLLVDAKPRHIWQVGEGRPHLVVFTDGAQPNPILGESGVAGIGGVALARDRAPTFFWAEVTQDILDEWIPRKTQIVLIETLAAVTALTTFADLLRGRLLILMVDSEAAEGALVKGYSGRADLCRLTGVFWAAAHLLETAIYIDRVPTDANPADGPSRGKLADAMRLGWVQVVPKIPRGHWGDARAWECLTRGPGRMLPLGPTPA
jgi:hypothetical protein